MAKLYDDVKVIDADTHFTEPPDLWTSRVRAAYKDRILHIEERNGVPTWVVDDVEARLRKGRRRSSTTTAARSRSWTRWTRASTGFTPGRGT